MALNVFLTFLVIASFTARQKLLRLWLILYYWCSRLHEDLMRQLIHSLFEHRWWWSVKSLLKRLMKNWLLMLNWVLLDRFLMRWIRLIHLMCPVAVEWRLWCWCYYWWNRPTIQFSAWCAYLNTNTFRCRFTHPSR